MYEFQLYQASDEHAEFSRALRHSLSLSMEVKQHIDSFNFFIEHEIKEIVKANRMVRSDVDSRFFLEWV